MKTKKIVAPIVITGITCLYYILFAIISVYIAIPTILKILGIVIPLIFVAVVIYVLIERIKEIRSGEEDDLSKY